MHKRIPRIAAYLFPTFENMLWISAFFYVLMFGQRLLNADGDLALHLSMGRYILTQRTIPLQDVFSHTLSGQPAAQHKWLSQLIFAAVERFFSLNGIVVLCALVIATTFWLVFIQTRRESRSIFPVVLVVFLTLMTSTVHWLMRPHVFTFLFLALWLMLLSQMVKGRIHLWWIFPGSMLLWVNLHGGFIAGLVTWALYGLGIGWDMIWRRCSVLPSRFWRYYLLSGVTAGFMTLLNPSGFGLWRMLVTHLGNPYLAAITLEFQSPNFHQAALWPFLLMIGLLVMVLGLTNRRFKSAQLFTTTAWLLMGLYSARNIPLFAIVSAPLLVQGLDELFSAAAQRSALFNRLKQMDGRILAVDQQLKGIVWPVLCLLVVVVGLSLGFRFDISGQAYAFDPDVFPVAAIDWLEQNPPEGEMFNSFTWGGYLQYRLWPDKQVFIDSNSDFYGEVFVRQYMQVIALEEGWEGVLDQYHVTWAILPLHLNTGDSMQSELGWEIIYKDQTAVILQRK